MFFFCVCEHKGADQLRCNRAVDQCLRFLYIDKIVQFLYCLNPKFQASSHLLLLYNPVCVGPDRKTIKTGVLMTRLIWCEEALVISLVLLLSEARPKKTGLLHMRKQRRRSASR